MPQDLIIDLLQVDRRYQRSVHLERDFTDVSALAGYVPTRHSDETLARIFAGLDQHPNRRAFRLTGNFGAGKSSFGLLLAHYLRDGISGLPKSLRDRWRGPVAKSRPGIIPVLVTGSREPINVAILRSLRHTLETLLGAKHLDAVAKLNKLLAAKGARITDSATLEILQSVNRELMEKRGAKGLVIILDELGKFLEFAVMHPERQDVFFLQQLAELSCGSSRYPLLVVGLLHQGFRDYAQTLSEPDQREWDKVAARFEEIVFKQPPEQITRLVGAALNVRPTDWPRHWEARAKDAMSTVAQRNWFGADASMSALAKEAPYIYPLHPSVLPVMIRFFSRFGQNERSLFSFLLSNEPGGLQEFARTHKPLPGVCYRLHNFYDYVSANFGDKLGALSLQSHWNQIEAICRSINARWPEKAMIAKSVGILNLIQSGQGSEIVATEEAVSAALYDTPAERQQSRDCMRALYKKDNVLHFRGKAGGYCLWSHASVNLYERYREASRSLSSSRRAGDAIRTRMLDTRPMVARRHYIETGNLRSFEIVYCTPGDLEGRVSAHVEDTDCRIVIPLCETNAEEGAALKFARTSKVPDQVLLGIPQPLNGLDGLLKELERWEWIQNNTPELKDDWFAAQEVNQKIDHARENLERRVQHFVGLRSPTGTMPLRWFHGGQERSFDSGCGFLSWLSEVCDDLFKDAPKIHNELINRRVLSSAAARARMRLVQSMFEASNKKLLGMDETKRPPQMSMYLSVLQETTIHREVSEGLWALDYPLPRDPAHLLPCLRAVRTRLESSPEARVPVTEIIQLLTSPRLGVREGLIPILLVLLLIKHQRDIALYENGTFLSEIAVEEILRLSKRPENFALQWCRIGGVRLSVFERLLQVLESATERKDADLLDVVRPLMKLVAGLPPYAKTTKMVSPMAQTIRAALLSAEDPTEMVFQTLPVACGMKPFAPSSADEERAEEYVQKLKSGLDELRAAYPTLINRMANQIGQAFGYELSGQATLMVEYRQQVARRAAALIPLVTDIELKGFCLRISDAALGDAAWLESFGSFVAASPPSRWKGQDEYAFLERLHLLAGKFARTEATHFSETANEPGSKRMLLTITHADGTEKTKVLHLTESETGKLIHLKADLAAKLGSDKQNAIAALTELAWELLSKPNP